MTYKEVAKLMKRADYSLAQNNGQMNQAYQDILRGMGGGAPYMSAPQQAPNVGAMGGGIMPLLLGLGIGGLFAGGLAGGFGKIPNGQQIGNDAYQGFKAGIKQDLTNMGNAALDTAKNVGVKAGQAAINSIPGANMVYQAGKAVYNNWDTIKNTAGQAWDTTKTVAGRIADTTKGAFSHISNAGAYDQMRLDALNKSITPDQVQQARQRRQENPNYLSSPIQQNQVQAQRARRRLPPSKKTWANQ